MPIELADEFASSVQRFASYRNVNEHFYDDAASKRRAQHQPGPTLKRTNDVVLRLERLKPGTGVRPIDSPQRLSVGCAQRARRRGRRRARLRVRRP